MTTHVKNNRPEMCPVVKRAAFHVAFLLHRAVSGRNYTSFYFICGAVTLEKNFKHEVGA